MSPTASAGSDQPLSSVGIVGGGAAGLITALTLQDRVPELDITVYEREAQPYTTLCAEGISQKTLHLFDAFDSVKHCPQSFVGASWWFPGPLEVLVDEPCYTLERSTWVPAMADAFQDRGGTLVTGRKVTPDQVPDLAGEHDLVVGADGPGSQVRKAIGGNAITRLGVQLRLKAPWDGDRLMFYTHKDFSPEYAWVFPKGDVLNVGILGEADGQDWDRVDAFRKWVDATWGTSLVDGSIVKREAYPIAFNGDKIAHENIVLTGDAAGLTNPLTKGGLAAIIHTARVLGQCVEDHAMGRTSTPAATSSSNGHTGRGPGHAVAATFDERIWKHPVADPNYQRALEVILDLDNREFERLARFAPDQVVAGSGAIKDKLLLGVGLATNPRRARDILVLYRAMSLSKGYSW